MMKLEREDFYAAFILKHLKSTPVTEQDVQNMKHIHGVDDKEFKKMEKSKGKVVRIKKSEIQEAPEVQFSKEVKNSSSGLMGLSRKSQGSRCFDGERVVSSKNEETPGVKCGEKVRKNSRESQGSRCFDGEKLATSKNQETPGVKCGEKVRKIPKKSHGSSCFDGEKLASSKNQETPRGECAQKVRKNSRKSHGSSCFDGEKLASSKNQETPRGECAQKVKKNARKSYGSSSVHGGKSKKARISPPRSINAPRLPPIESIKSKIGQSSNPFTKRLWNSDVNEHQGRLLLPTEIAKKHLLPMLNQEEIEDIGVGVVVKTYDPMGNSSPMEFKTWRNKSYVLLSGWTQFFQQHELKTNDVVVGWMFRDKQTNELCIALTWTKYDGGDDKTALNSNSDSSVISHESREIQEL